MGEAHPELRNAIAHADYAFYSDRLRTLNPDRDMAAKDVYEFVVRAVAYHAAIANLYFYHLKSYRVPKVLAMHPAWRGPPNERGVVMVRDDYGAIGLKAAWTREELARGHIQWRMSRTTPEEEAMMRVDPTRAHFQAVAPTAEASPQRRSKLKSVVDKLMQWLGIVR